MIRRELMFADGVKHWLLISQVEHARLSGVLAEKCIERFGGGPSIDPAREELLAAIFHHDDGWREWEQAPRRDPQTGRPLSFLELPMDEAIGIWNRSIQVATKIGNLSAWTVAGHFSALLCTVGQHASEPVAREWLRETASKRSQWFADWHAQDEATHTAELTGEALKWLQSFDILSLWPCSQYPVAGEQAARLPEPFHLPDGSVVREIRPSTRQAPNEPCRIVFEPWPFEASEFTLQAAAHLVLARHYSSSQELLAAREPFVAEWVIAGR